MTQNKKIRLIFTIALGLFCLSASTSFAAITVSGTTDMSDGGTVAVAVNDTLQAQTGTIASGTWSIASVTQPSADDIITVFVSGADDADESTGVTKYDGTGDITGMVLNQNVLTLGSDDNQSLSITNLGQYDNDDDEDIMHTAGTEGPGMLTVDDDDSYADDTLTILASNTLTVTATETVTAHNVTIAGTITSGGASTYNVSGDWDNNGTFTQSTSTVTFNGTAAQDVAHNSGNFGTVAVTNSDAAVTFSEAFTTVNLTSTTAGAELTFQANTTFTISGTLTLTGDPADVITLDSSDSSNAFTLDVTGSAQTVTSVSVSNASASTNDITANYSLNMTNNDDASDSPHWIFSSTEFVNSIEEDGTGDYTTLNAWEAAINCDLYRSATTEWDGQTGLDIADGTAVTWDGGASSGTLVHMTTVAKSGTDAFLLQITSGSLDDDDIVTDGGGNSFVVNGTPTAAQATAKIDGAWTSADTTAITISGWTTDETHYVKVYTTTSARHNGAWDTSAYRIAPSGSYVRALNIEENNVTIDGLQIYMNFDTGTFDNYGIQISATNVTIKNCGVYAIFGAGMTSVACIGIHVVSTFKDMYIYNNVVSGFYSLTGNNYTGILFSQGDADTNAFVYNNTVYHCNRGYRDVPNALEVTYKNNIAHSCDDDWVVYRADASSKNNLGEDAYETNMGTNFVQTTQTAEQMFKDPSNNNLHLVSTSDASNAGADLSSDSNLPITYDIDGETRPYFTTWDIGADESTEEASTFTESNAIWFGTNF